MDQFHGDRTETNVIAIGNDTILARDGVAEQVDCGIGSDTAQVDAGDVVDATCESVDRPQVIAPAPPPGRSGRSAAQEVASRRSRGRASVCIACPAACTVTAELRVDKKIARKLKLGKSRVLARGKSRWPPPARRA